jgi:hypothetical protein
MYKSLIEVIYGNMTKQIDDKIFKAVMEYDIKVDREELLLALKYDRQQYEKGYADGKADAAPRWIPVSERLPESQNPVLVVAVSKGMGLPYIFKAAHINHHEITEDEYGWTDGEYDSEYDEENDCFWIPECWYECNAVEGNTNWVMDEDYTITHWMPLPQPPKGE